MKFHTSGLTPSQFEILPKLSTLLGDWQFYLAGGTAVSVYFGHRLSVDLDWFSSSSIPEPIILSKIISNAGVPFQTVSIERGTLHGSILNVRVSFFEYLYPMLEPLVFWDQGECSLASLSDLACMKLVAIAQRGSRKDFIDLYTIVKNYKPLPELFVLYQRKYQVQDITSVLMSLVYFDDAEQEAEPQNWSGNWQVVKKEISKWVRQI